MDNFLLFILGLTVTLIAGLGVAVYCITLGYKKINPPEIIAEIPPEENKSMESFVEIPSVS